jgi:hypothetical protein
MPDTGLDVLNSDGDSIEVALAKQLLGKEQAVIVKPQPVQAPTLPFGWTQVADIPKYQDDRLTAGQLESELCQYTGSEQWHRHSLNRQMLYTDGVQFFAESGGGQGAYWLLDIIATEYWPLLKNEPFLAISVTVKDEAAKIEVTDGNGRVLKVRALAYTDLQAGVWKFYLTDNVLLLPSEY